jgi:hypothetical protein
VWKKALLLVVFPFRLFSQDAYKSGYGKIISEIIIYAVTDVHTADEINEKSEYFFEFYGSI